MPEITVRPYIKDWSKELATAIDSDYSRILFNAPTGSGKTIFAAVEFKKRYKTLRCLFLTHRRKLSDQTVKKFTSLGIEDISMIMAGKAYDKKCNVQIGTIQSFTKKEYGKFDFIMIDEVHFGHKTESRRKLIQDYSDATIVGLTATPIDSQGYLLEDFDQYIGKIQMADLIEQGWLVPFVYEVPYTPDLSQVRVGADNEYIISDLEDVMNLQEVNKTVFDNWSTKAKGRKTMVFCVSIEHATNVYSYFLDKGVKTAIVHSGLPEPAVLSNYEYFSKDAEVLINVDMATTGFDETSVSCIVLIRAFHSLRLYLQVGGRGGRSHEGKSDCLILDFGGNFERHGHLEEVRDYEFKAVFGKRIDRELGIDEDLEKRQKMIDKTPIDKKMYLKRVGSMLDLFSDKVYTHEDELLADTKKFLKHSGFFFWRQNSGVVNMGEYKKPRWVHFTDIKGLPDITMFAKFASVYIGLELKVPNAPFTDNQKATLPKFHKEGIIFFIVDSINELWAIIKHIRRNVVETPDGILIKNSVKNLWEHQIKYRNKLKIGV